MDSRPSSRVPNELFNGGSRAITDGNSHKRGRSALLAHPFQSRLYEMVVRQLHHDGYLAAASAVADATGTTVPRVDEDGSQLSRLVAGGMSVESLQQREIKRFRAEEAVERHLDMSKLYLPQVFTNSWAVGRRHFKYRERFSTASLGGAIRDICFSPDGSLVACAGAGGVAVVFSLETLEDLTALEEVRAANRARGLDGSAHKSKEIQAQMGMSGTNVNEITNLATARSYHEHTQPVEVMRFHPTQPTLLTGGLDGDLFIREYGLPDGRVQLHIKDQFPIRAASFHPSGEYVLFGTDDPSLRLLNIATEKLMTPPVTEGSAFHSTAPGAAAAGAPMSPSEKLQHSAGLTAASFASDGRTFVSASLDGTWALYDGVSGKMLHRHLHAHSGVPVTSATFSRSGQVLLTAGMDSTARLWDLRVLSSSGTCWSSSEVNGTIKACELVSFGEPAKCDDRSIKATFTADEGHVLCQDTTLLAVHAHAVFTGDISYTLTTQPAFIQRGLAASPFANAIVTGGDDFRVRLWTPSWLPS